VRRVGAWITGLAIAAACTVIATVRASADLTAPACTPLRIEPVRITVAAGEQADFHASGGTGIATFALVGGADGGGASIEPGGALHAGDREASFDVIARNAACGATATARVSVVAPLAVEPPEGRVAIGGAFHFAIRGGDGATRARLLGDPRGAAIRDDGMFKAPAHPGRWQAVVTDGSRREVVVVIDVLETLAPLRSRTPIVAVPPGGRAPLSWAGGSGSLDVTLAPATGARIERDSSGGASVVLEAGAPMTIDARAVDRVTHEEAHTRLIVGARLGNGGDHTGTMVSFAPVDASIEAFVADDPARSESSRVTRFDLQSAGAPKVGRHDPAHLGGSAPVSIDFDGDGVPELAIADLHVWPQRLGAGEIDPDGCLARPDLASVGSGVIHIYASASDGLVERARVIAPGSPGNRPDGFGQTLAVADVNGDHKGDLVVGRRDRRGVEVVLGRSFVPGKIVLACHDEKGDSASLAYPAAGGRFQGGVWGERIATIGDVDRDGCDDVAFTSARDGLNPIGIVVAFGYDAGRTRCQGHAQALAFVLVSSDHVWSPDPSALFSRLAARPDLELRRPGSALASDAGDLTGDGVPDLVFGDKELNDKTGRGPAVEIVSGAFLASICPRHVCTEGAHPGSFFQGDARFVALTAAGPKDRIVLRGAPLDRGFGEAIAIADLDGDRHVDLAIGAPEGSEAAPFTGDLSVFKGPFEATADAHRSPWLLAVGVPREPSAFGASVAVVRSGGAPWLLVGAPQSTGSDGKANAGAAYLFRLDGRSE